MKRIIFITYENVFRNGILIAMVLKPAIMLAEKYKIKITITSAIKEGEIDDIYITNKKKYISKYVDVIEFNKSINEKQSILSFLSDIFKQYLFLVKYVNRSDIVHARGYGGAFIATLIKIRLGNDWIFDIRGTLPEETVDLGKIRKISFKYFLLKVAEFCFLNFSNIVVAVSYQMQKHFKRYTFRKIYVIRNPTTLSDYNKRKRRNLTPKNIVYLGSLQNWHLPIETLSIMQEMSKLSKTPIKFTLITSDTKSAYNYISRLCLDISIEVKSLAYDLIPSELSKFDLGFCLIKPTFSKSVCMPVKFNEYLAAGVFIISNKSIGDLESIINKKSGYILEDLSSLDNAKLIFENYNSEIDYLSYPPDLFWDFEGINKLAKLYGLL